MTLKGSLWSKQLLDSIRFHLTFWLLYSAVRMCPDRHAKEWIKFGLRVAGKGIEKGLISDESL